MTEIDERYKEGKIYGIRNITDDTKIYIGSTIISLAQRFKQHKTKCKNGIECVLYNNIENNDWTLWYIELYENIMGEKFVKADISDINNRIEKNVLDYLSK